MLAGFIATLTSGLLQLASANYAQMRSDLQLSAALSASGALLGHYFGLSEELEPLDAAASPKHGESFRLGYTAAGNSDCSLQSNVYGVDDWVENDFSVEADGGAWQLRCRAATNQALQTHIANLRLRYGVDLGSWQGGSFVVGAFDKLPDIYLSAAEASSQSDLAGVKLTLLAAINSGASVGGAQALSDAYGDLAPLAGAVDNTRLRLSARTYQTPNH